MGEKESGINFEGLVGLAFDSHYRMDGSSEDIGFIFRVLELKGGPKAECRLFVASMQELQGGFYASIGRFFRNPSEGYWEIDFQKEQRQWDHYSSSRFEFNGIIEPAPSGIIVSNGIVNEYRPASLQGKNLVYVRHNTGSFKMFRHEEPKLR